jgi:hypothetical protein
VNDITGWFDWFLCLPWFDGAVCAYCDGLCAVYVFTCMYVCMSDSLYPSYCYSNGRVRNVEVLYRCLVMVQLVVTILFSNGAAGCCNIVW